MRYQVTYLAVLLAVTVSGCSNGGGVPAHPKITETQIRAESAPAVYGGKLRRILADVDQEKLEARGLSLMDVQKALLKQNVLIPAGNAKIGRVDF